MGAEVTGSDRTWWRRYSPAWWHAGSLDGFPLREALVPTRQGPVCDLDFPPDGRRQLLVGRRDGPG